MKDGFCIQAILKQLKLPQIGICGYTIQLTKVPSENEKKKYSWQKKHLANKTGTKDSYKPTKIKKLALNKEI